MERSSNPTRVVLATSAFLLFAGCCHCPEIPPPPIAPVAMMPAPAAAPVAVPPAPPAGEEAPIAAAPEPKGPQYQTPESVLWDADADVLYVSNIAGDPTGLDKNGFISKVAPDGQILELKWIDGSKPESELSAPKGLAIAGDLLYVTDLTVVRKFDRKTGKAKGKISIPKAVFLNDLAVSPDGKTLYISDTGVKGDSRGFTSTGDDAVYAVELKKGTVKALYKDKDLRGPNGLWADDDGVWVNTMNANELFHISKKGKKGPITTLPKGGLDGLVKLPDGSFLVSSWAAQAIYRGLPGGEFKEFLTQTPSPADMGFDGKRNRVLIPVFLASTVDIRPLPTLTPLNPSAPPKAPSKVEAK